MTTEAIIQQEGNVLDACIVPQRMPPPPRSKTGNGTVAESFGLNTQAILPVKAAEILLMIAGLKERIKEAGIPLGKTIVYLELDANTTKLLTTIGATTTETIIQRDGHTLDAFIMSQGRPVRTDSKAGSEAAIYGLNTQAVLPVKAAEILSMIADLKERLIDAGIPIGRSIVLTEVDFSTTKITTV